MLAQPRPQLLADIGHRREVVDPAAIDPMHDLVGPERLFTPALELRAQASPVQAEQIHSR